MVIFGIPLTPMKEELHTADLDLMGTFYAENTIFDSLAQRSAHLMRLFLDQGTNQGYLSDLEKFLHIRNTPTH